MRQCIEALRTVRARGLLAGTCLLAVLGCLWLSAREGEAAEPVGSADGAVIGRPSGGFSVAEVESGARIPTGNTESGRARAGCCVTVLSEAGLPVVGAALCRLPTPRQLTEADSAVLARSDAAGRIELFAPDSINVAEVVLAEGFVPSKLDRPLKIGDDRVVKLVGGLSQVIECVDVRGNALPGCTVVASRQSLGLTHMAGGRSSGGIPGATGAALFEALSGKDGRVLLAGLSLARYRYTVTKSGMVAVRAPSPIAFEPSGDPIRVVLAPLYVFAVEADPKRVYAHAFRFDGKFVAANLPNPVLEHCRARIADTHPEAYVAVAALVEANVTPAAVLRVLLASGEVHELSVTGVEWEAFRAPQTLEAPESHRPSDDESRLWFFDADGREHSALGLTVTIGDSFFNGFVVSADSDGRLHVPAGRHALSHDTLLLAGPLSPESFQAPDNVVVTASVGLRRCVFEGRFEDGELSSEATWTLTAGGRAATVQALAGSRIERLLPVGALGVRAQAYGRPPGEQVVEILPADADEPQVIAITL
jgi:hypothetical protein